MPRSNQTKQLLAQSLQELMATTPLEKISVNDIVDHANVGRNTFYYRFEDKYDLVNWYFQSGITRFLVELSAYSSWNALLAALETYFLENKVFSEAEAHTVMAEQREIEGFAAFLVRYRQALEIERTAVAVLPD